MANKLSDIMLVDKTLLLFRNTSDFTEFAVRGHNFGSDSQNSNISDINTIKINVKSETKKADHHLSDFPGIENGASTLYIKKLHRFDYLYGKYDRKEDKMTIKHFPRNNRLEENAKEPSIISSFLENQPEVMNIFFKKFGLEEMIIFPITSAPEKENHIQEEDANQCRLLGFVISYNKTYRHLGKNWESIIRSLAQAISVGVDHSDQLFTQKTESDRILRHQIKAYTNTISATIETIRIESNWLKNTIQMKSNEKNEELTAISKISNRINMIHDELIPDLHAQIDALKSEPILNRLGINHAKMAGPVDLIDFLHEQISLFGHKKKERKLFIDTSELHSRFHVNIQPIVLFHIINNLLTNIIKYSENKRTVKIYSLRRYSKVIVFENVARCRDGDILHSKHEDSDGVGLFIVEILCKIFLKKKIMIDTSHKFLINKDKYYTYKVSLDFSKIAI